MLFNIRKITAAITISYILLMLVLMSIFDVSYSWFFLKTVSYSSISEWFPNYTIPAFLVLKILPILGLVILVALQFTLLYRYKFNVVSLSNEMTNKDKFIVLFLFFFSIAFIYLNIGEFNAGHNLVIIGSIGFLFLYIYLFKQLPSSNFQLVFLIVLAILLRYLFYIHASPFDMQEDSLARISQVYSWQKYGGIPGGLNWPGAHHLLIYFVSKIFQVPFEVGGRLLSFITSLLIIPFAYELFTLLFNKKTAFFSLFFYAINPFIIKFSTIQMTEIPFLFFMTLGIYYGYKYFKNSKTNYLFLSIIPLNIASLMRFEAWIIIPLFIAIFLLRYGNYKKVIKWSALAMTSALLFSLYSFIKSGNPISGVTASDVEVIASLKGQTIIDSIKVLVSGPWLPLYLFPFIILGFLYSLQKGKHKYLIFFISLLSSYYLFKMGQMTLMPFWRYLIFVLFFSIPFMFYYLERKLSLMAFFLFFLISYMNYTLTDIKSTYETTSPPIPGLLESAEYVKLNHLGKEDSKIILSIDPYSNDDIWLIFSGLYRDYPIFRRLHPGSGNNFYGELFTKENLIKNITERDFNLILVQEGYEIDSVLKSPKVIDFLKQKTVDTTYFGQHTLYYIN